MVMGRTHLIIGVITALLIQPLISGNKYIIFTLIIISSLLPDIDHTKSKMGSKFKILSVPISTVFGHRGFFHSIWAALLVATPIYLFWNHSYAIAVVAGFLSHLFGDALTPMGINLIHPLQKLHISGFIETNSMTENLLTIILIIITIFLII